MHFERNRYRSDSDFLYIDALKYYTVDSNILMGIAALMTAIAQRRVIRGQAAEVPEAVQILKLAGTVSVTLTMLITIFFLGPTIGRVYGFFSLFANSSLFLHLINPLVAIAVFAWLERPGRIPKGKILWGIVPTVAYAIYYVALTLSHVAGDRIAKGYDWYEFFCFRDPCVVDCGDCHSADYVWYYVGAVETEPGETGEKDRYAMTV